MKPLLTVIPCIQYALWYTIDRHGLQYLGLHKSVRRWISLREGNILHPSGNQVLGQDNLVSEYYRVCGVSV